MAPHGPRPPLTAPRPGSRAGRRRLGAAAAVLCTLMLAAPAVPAQNEASEEALRAAVVFNLARFAEWPPQAFAVAEAPLTLCTVGATAEQNEAFMALAGRMIGNRPLQLRANIGTREIGDCRILFVGRADEAWIEAGRRPYLLSVGVGLAFAEGGGVVGLYRSGDRLRFAVNLKSMQSAGIRIGSQALQLARIVGER
ncbi:MAG TPA: YfiR family protein [Burkholderiaceae bacterium]